ncbi:MAG TPA: WGR domain-containing protein [Xanthomonadaceae bacterium]|jgi:predicted DNA-binding WGR domain protein|nr:WGR domain-containing protein [Xanthomonadaceae bacterium]
MRLLLQHPPVGAEAPRFLQLTLEQDLLGGWLLLRETGQIGQRSTIKREQFLQQAEAMAAFEHHRDQNVRRGFRVMFAQGEAARL